MNLDNAMCISLWQPWASAIAWGYKRYETRSWRTHHRGPLLIHASKRWTPDLRFARMDLTRKARMLIGCGYPGLFELETGELPLGCVVAVAELIECYHTEDLVGMSCRVIARPDVSDLDRLFGDWTYGRYAWHLPDVIRLPRPVPCAGHQGLWRPSAEVLAAVRRQMTEAPCF